LDSLRGFLRRPALIDLQTAGQPSVLNNALALSSSERDDAGIRAINIAIDNARTERGKTRAEIARRFPSYADLIDPKSPTVEETRQALRPGEALVSFYFGRERSPSR
jgi:hypothetical protein